jgi:hypothetical protein
MGKTGNAYIILVRKFLRKRQPERPEFVYVEEDNIKIDLR